MPRPILAQIDRAAVRHNLGVARQYARGRKVWAVIKANAYGHGIERVLPALDTADGVALLDLNEAQRVRDQGWRKPILLLEGFFAPSDLALVTALQLTPVLHHVAQIEMLAQHSPQAPLEVYVKLNTGMNRLGLDTNELAPALQRLQGMKNVKVAALMTHFANAEDLRPGVLDAALLRFNTPLAQWAGDTSLANSSALLLQSQVGGHSVRPGIMLYGATPAAGTPVTQWGLRPAMHLRSELIAVRTLAVGEHVGYGGRWTASRPLRVGVVACGYADGYPRVAPDGTPVAVEGQLAPLVGQVSMDMITVDLTDVPQAQVGSTAELWGAQVPIDVVAERAGTVGYELMCALAQRVPVQMVE